MTKDAFTAQVLERLAARGWELPQPPPPAGMYEPFRLDRGGGYLAGQFPARGGNKVLRGRVGRELGLAEAVLEGAWEVFVVALGERGKHARTALGVPRLPLDDSVKLVVTFGYD